MHRKSRCRIVPATLPDAAGNPLPTIAPATGASLQLRTSSCSVKATRTCWRRRLTMRSGLWRNPA
jgi:hypothetical protein